MTSAQLQTVKAKEDIRAFVYGMLTTTMREAAPQTRGETRLAAAPKRIAGDACLAMRSSCAPERTPGHTCTIIVVSVLTLAAALGLGYAAQVDLASDLTATIARSNQLPIAARPRAGTNHTKFLLNALLVPALDADALPLRWVDPRRPAQCGPNTTVRVNGAPLLAGTLVPDQPFELEWQADACRPFGKAGLRYDGGVKLTVYREDWRFSATVEPRHMRITSASNAVALLRAGAVSLPPQGNPDKPVTLTADCAGGAQPCL
jgi:hypothetical protein